MQRSVNYIAGAYRGKTVSEIRRNIEKAREVAERVWAAGHVAICPHLNTAFMDGVAPDEVFLEGDLILLKFCQNMILVSGWENSSGTKNEIEFARANHIEVYDSIERWEHYLLPQSYYDIVDMEDLENDGHIVTSDELKFGHRNSFKG